MQILQNEIECLHCGQRIYSAFRHHYNECKCGKSMVDGGMDYFRQSMTPYIDHIPYNIAISDETYSKLFNAIKWAEGNNRNARALICAIFRVLREQGFDVYHEMERHGKWYWYRHRFTTYINHFIQKVKQWIQ